MLAKNGLTTLVSRLAIEQGYCIDEHIFDNVPCTVEDYTNAALEAEGFTPGVGGDYWRDVRRVVTEVFERYSLLD